METEAERMQRLIAQRQALVSDLCQKSYATSISDTRTAVAYGRALGTLSVFDGVHPEVAVAHMRKMRDDIRAGVVEHQKEAP